MAITLKILQKVLVSYFYQVNAGFFLFGFFVLFGLPYSPVAFHVSIITGIIQSQVFVAVVLCAWVLYYLKCINYTVRQLQHPRQSFLFCFSNLPGRKLFRYMLYVQIFISLPILLYAAAITWFAFKNRYYLTAAEVLLFNTAALSATALLYGAVIQKKELNVGFRLPGVRLRFPKPFFLVPFLYLFNSQKQMLLVTKVFSLLLLFAFFRLSQPDNHDVRPLLLCLLLVAAAHIAIVFEARTFQETYLSFSRNLPLPIISRFLQTAAMYACLLLPELLFLFKGFPAFFLLAGYPQVAFLPVALLCLFHTVLLMDDLQMEQFIRVVFGIAAGCFFIILYSPGIYLSLAILLFSFAFFNAYYYSYEKKVN